MEFTEDQLTALRMLVMGRSRAQVAKHLGMTETTFSRRLRGVYIAAGTNSTMETAVKLVLLGHLTFDVEKDFPNRWGA